MSRGWQICMNTIVFVIDSKYELETASLPPPPEEMRVYCISIGSVYMSIHTNWKLLTLFLHKVECILTRSSSKIISGWRSDGLDRHPDFTMQFPVYRCSVVVLKGFIVKNYKLALKCYIGPTSLKNTHRGI